MKNKPEPIAIVGMSGRFPGADDVDSFWWNLKNGCETVTEMPTNRGWRIEDYFDPVPQTPGKTYSKRGGFLDGIDLFDPLFFEIPPNHAERMDPSARLFIQEAWRAIEDAGHSPSSLDGSSCGMFFCAKGDYPTIVQRYDETYLASTDSFGPARLAYHLNLVGPAVAIDTACSSTLSALSYACDAISLGHCDAALVGGGGINTTPNALVTSSQFLLFSPSDRCFTFDARADGTIIGEAIGAVFLKRRDKAIEDGDHIYGLVRGWGTNQDGRTNGVTAPSAKSQTRLQTEIYERFAIDPADISMVEAHGTGTKLGDPIEVQALTESFRSFTNKRHFCALGACKTNIGHAFFGAGISSVIKVLQSIRHKTIPATLNYETPNPAINLEDSPFFVNTQTIPWTVNEGQRRCAAINSFGATGINAHVVIEEPGCDLNNTSRYIGVQQSVESVAVPLSAKGRDQLKEIARSLCDHVLEEREVFSSEEDTSLYLLDLAYTLQVGRDAMSERASIVVGSLDELVQSLHGFTAVDTFSESRWHEGSLPSGVIARMSLVSSKKQSVTDAIKQRDWPTLARLWAEGADVDWSSLYQEGDRVKPKRTRLPTYPFLRERCWIADDQREQDLSEDKAAEQRPRALETLHPLVHEEVSIDGAFSFRSTFTGRETFFEDHRIQGERLLPGVAYLEMARAAYARILERHGVSAAGSICLENVVWLRPFVFADDNKSLRINLRLLETAVSGDLTHLHFEVCSDSERILYCQGRVCLDRVAEPALVDLGRVRDECQASHIAGAELYPMLRSLGFLLGPAHQAVEDLFIGENQVLGKLILPQSAGGDYTLHPSLMDAALHATAGLVPDREKLDKASHLKLPFELRKLTIFHSCTSPMWVSARPAKQHPENSNVTRTDIELCDENGKVLIRMNGLVSRTLRAESTVSGEVTASSESKQSVDTFLMRPVWRQETAASVHTDTSFTQHHIIVCTDSAGAKLFKSVDSILGVDGTTRILIKKSESNEAAYGRACRSVFKNVQRILKELKEESQSKHKVLVQLVIHGGVNADYFRRIGTLLKSAAQEDTRFTGQVIITSGTKSEEALVDMLRAEAGIQTQDVVRYVDDGREYEDFEEIPGISMDEDHRNDDSLADLPWKSGGVYLIVGGAGGLGRIFADEIVQAQPSAKLVLVGRSDLDADAKQELDDLKKERTSVIYRQADVSDEQSIASLVVEVTERWGGINGVIHSAGSLADNYIHKKSQADLKKVFLSKVDGLAVLDQATAQLDLDFFVAFSSLAGVWGNAGQSDYAMANGFVDAFLSERQDKVDRGERSGVSVSINWPLWLDGGMSVDDTYQEYAYLKTGMKPLDRASGLSAFYAALTCKRPQVLVVHANKKKFFGYARRSGAGPSPMVDERLETPAISSADKADLLASLIEQVKFHVGQIIHIDPKRVDEYADLSDFGLDSVSLTQLANALNRQYGLDLSPTAFFEHANLQDFSEYLLGAYGEILNRYLTDKKESDGLLESHSGTPADDSTPAKSKRGSRTASLTTIDLRDCGKDIEETVPERKPEPIAIIGMSCQFPMANDPYQYWENLQAGRDCITEIPADRWDWRTIYGDPHEQGGVTNIKWGGFIDGIGNFDPAFFSISPREAELMDPQHRLLLTHVWKAIENAGYSPRSLSGGNTAVFVGTSDSGYYDLFEEAGLTYDGSGTPASIAPNRVSFFFDFHGPSEPVETACSSSLVALHKGVWAIRNGVCENAIVGGVQLIPTSKKHISFSQGDVLSPDGRCKTFSADANGYVRAEGVGILVLKRLSEAERDGDFVHGVILGSAENHGGRANSLTSPNPRSQSELLLSAYREAAIDPRTIGYIEAHGTGTELGDPIELNALKSAFEKLYEETENSSHMPAEKFQGLCGVGSVKTNIGHTELAAGVAGVIKVLMQFRHQSLAQSIHYTEQNPHIDLAESPFYLIDEPAIWSRRKDKNGQSLPLRAGVSSFGVGGVNAHVILEESMPADENSRIFDEVSETQIVVLSAKDEMVLNELAGQLLSFLNRTEYLSVSHTLRNIAFTLQTGREHMTERFAVVSNSIADLKKKLNAFLNRGGGAIYRGNVKAMQSNALSESGGALSTLVDNWLEQEDYDSLAEMWSKGLEVDWNKLYTDKPAQRVDLPSYPFRQDRYWITESRGKQPSGIERSPVHVGPQDTSLNTPLAAGEVVRQDKPALMRDRPASDRRPPYTDKTQPIDDTYSAPKENGNGSALSIAALTDELRSSLAAALFVDEKELEVDQAFVEMGVDSVTGAEWMRTISRQYGVPIKLTTIYDNPNLRTLSEFLMGLIDQHGLATPGGQRSAIADTTEPVALSNNEGQSPRLMSPADDVARPEPNSEELATLFNDVVEGRAASPARSSTEAVSVPRSFSSSGADGAPSRSIENTTDIAVVGMSCEFPKAPSAVEFWRRIVSGDDCISQIPHERWNDSRKGFLSRMKIDPDFQYDGMGIIQDADKFDPTLFSISPKEARLMDPQQRVFLQNSWRCFEDAGYAPSSLTGTQCGVFVGCSTGVYGMFGTPDLTTHALMGNAASILASRISYLLNLKGPCLAIDTACSSSLVAVSEACTNLAFGNCDFALAGGVNVFSSAEYVTSAVEGGMLSADGHCFTFDNRANGFVPSEGVGVLLLKRLADAKRDGDQIHGVIRAWGVNHDGRTNGMTAPSGASQIALQKSVYDRFSIEPESITFVETHGTGTRIGDPIEVQALTDTFQSYTDEKNFCALGSVKASIGHTLAAAGVAGAIKALLALKEKVLPPLACFQSLNEEIDLENSPFYVSTEAQRWLSHKGAVRRAAVSSFSYCGTNAHIVIDEYPADRLAIPAGTNAEYPVVLSAANMDRLREHAENLERYLEGRRGGNAREGREAEQDSLRDIAYTLQVGRDHMRARLGILATSLSDLADKLRHFLTSEDGEPASSVFLNELSGKNSRLAQDSTDVLALTVNDAIQRKDSATLLQLWCDGAVIPWEGLYGLPKPARVSLPTYPFRKTRYWIEAPIDSSAPQNGIGRNEESECSSSSDVFPDHLEAQFRQLISTL